MSLCQDICSIILPTILTKKEPFFLFQEQDKPRQEMELQINGGGGLRLKNNHTRTKPEKTKTQRHKKRIGRLCIQTWHGDGRWRSEDCSDDARKTSKPPANNSSTISMS